MKIHHQFIICVAVSFLAGLGTGWMAHPLYQVGRILDAARAGDKPAGAAVADRLGGVVKVQAHTNADPSMAYLEVVYTHGNRQWWPLK